MKNKQPKQKMIYITHDGKRFKDMKKGFEYDLAAARHIANELWFIKTKEAVDGFNLISASDYETCIESYNHTQDIHTMINLFIEAPIIYCATERAAKVFTGFMRNPSKSELEIKGLRKGLNYWFDGNDCFHHEEDFTDFFDGTAAEQSFENLRNSILNFISENVVIGKTLED